MTDNETRDSITVQDENGNNKEMVIEALFDMDDDSYALLTSDEDMVLMRIVEGDDNEQYLESIEDPDEASAILDAYQIAVDAAPADEL